MKIGWLVGTLSLFFALVKTATQEGSYLLNFSSLMSFRTR